MWYVKWIVYNSHRFNIILYPTIFVFTKKIFIRFSVIIPVLNYELSKLINENLSSVFCFFSFNRFIRSIAAVLHIYPIHEASINLSTNQSNCFISTIRSRCNALNTITLLTNIKIPKIRSTIQTFTIFHCVTTLNYFTFNTKFALLVKLTIKKINF